MDNEPHPDKKQRLTLLSRIAIICGIGSLTFSLTSSLALYTNWDIFPGEAIGPHPWVGSVGEWLSVVGFYGGLAAMLMSFISLVSSLHKKPRYINIAASVFGFTIALFAVWTVPATLDRMRARQRELSCHNLRHLGYSLKKYSEEHNSQLPHTINWCDELIKFDSYSSQEMRKRWVKNDEGLSEFAFNTNLSDMKLAEMPKNVVLLFETNLSKNPAGGAELITAENHPLKGCFILFADMHIAFVRAEDFNNLRWKPDKK